VLQGRQDSNLQLPVLEAGGFSLNHPEGGGQFAPVLAPVRFVCARSLLACARSGKLGWTWSI
jgi:hypothetical protein